MERLPIPQRSSSYGMCTTIPRETSKLIELPDDLEED